MKTALLLMALVTSSFSAQANINRTLLEFSSSPVISTLGTTLYISMSDSAKEARQVMADGQEYTLSGELTPFLGENVKNVQAHADVSVDEAVDILMDLADELLSTSSK